MADKKTPSKNKSNHEKRTAQSAPKSAEEKEARLANERAKEEEYKKKHATAGRGKRIAAIVFAVILICAFAIPTSALLLSSSSDSSSSEETYELDAEYREQLDTYWDLYEAADSSSLYYSYIADTYYDWGYYVMMGEESAYEATDLFAAAATYYNTYLLTYDDSDAMINLAMAYFYSDDTDNGIDVLEEGIELYPENAIMYSRLGILIAESDDPDYDAALEYLAMAQELDPDDEDGAYSEAETEISLIEAVLEASDELEDSDSDSTDTTEDEEESSE